MFLLALLALLPLLAAADGTAMVRVTNSGPVPIMVEGQKIDPSGMVSLRSVPAKRSGTPCIDARPASRSSAWAYTAEISSSSRSRSISKTAAPKLR